MDIKLICVPFAELTLPQLYEVLRLRSEVFVVEQNCIYQDMDNKDVKDGVYHLLLLNEDEVVGYSRLLPKQISFDTPSIGRILTSSKVRGSGIGRQLIQRSIEHTNRLWPNEAITIGAQSHLVKFYQEFGFIEVSAHYLEDGIKHVDMRLDTK